MHWKVCGWKWSWVIFRYCLRLHLNELTGTSRIHRQFSRYLNPGPPVHEAVCYLLGCDIRRYGDSVKFWIGGDAYFESFPSITDVCLLVTFAVFAQ
jgi:hypothetical protein